MPPSGIATAHAVFPCGWLTATQKDGSHKQQPRSANGEHTQSNTQAGRKGKAKTQRNKNERRSTVETKMMIMFAFMEVQIILVYVSTLLQRKK
jgi:uncharacterized membrane protein YvbJ